MYEMACEAERNEVMRGNYNYRGLFGWLTGGLYEYAYIQQAWYPEDFAEEWMDFASLQR
jgi:hypothetical protein